MKKLALTLLLFLISCTPRTEYGVCIGISQSDADPKLIYKVSVRNAIWTFLAVETVIAPLFWATDFAQCPVGVKK